MTSRSGLINSSLEKHERNSKLVDFRYGENLFMFVSPERFVIEDFREVTKNLDYSNFGLAFSYCVIDEVHCVSEWGHDFRTTYLMLGENAQNWTKTRNEKVKVSLIGLTATATFDVLADIERELKIERDDISDAIIMIENTIRPELFFRVIDVTNKNRISALNKDFEKIGENLSKYNSKEEMEKSLTHHFKEFENIEKLDEKSLSHYFKEFENIEKLDEKTREKVFENMKNGEFHFNDNYINTFLIEEEDKDGNKILIEN